MNALFQTDRIGTLSTILGPDALVLRRVTGTDALSDLFCYEVEALAVRDDLDFDVVLGTHATVTLQTGDGPVPRDGIVTEVRWLGPGPSGWLYSLTLRPWPWVSGRRRNQRIFHNKTVVEILEELWADYAHLGDPHVEIDLSNDYPELEYTVQYRESDLNFARRMMERHGISFHFRHAEGSHSIVLTDSVITHDRIGERPYYAAGQSLAAEVEHFSDWGPRRRLVTGAIRLTDYNFKKPTQAMETHQVGDAVHPEGTVESYDYPGDYLELGRGRTVASLRTEEERGGDDRFHATSDIMGLLAGKVVALGGGDPAPGNGTEFLCLRTDIAVTAQSYGSGDAEGDEKSFVARHVLLPVDAPMVPPRVTPLAVVQGPQTGTVVGEGEIDCDEYGRILVHMHWDLDKAYTMRCRVSQNWASKGWGGIVIPRIGMEVVVEFLEGDPDKPLVTGCVYNGKNDVPYPLPEHKTKSVFRSDSHMSEGFNEITFEDATGAENISLHAQKDQTLKVLNNRAKRVDNDQVESVGENKSIEVGRNHQEKIGGSMNLSVGGGGGSAIFGILSGLMGNSSAAMKSSAGESGDNWVSSFAGNMGKLATAAEALSLPGNMGFNTAGAHSKVAGLNQTTAASALGSLVGKVMPTSGILTTIVEKARSDTIGLARTEQIGLMKNTYVGKVQNTTVGVKRSVNVGDTQVTNVGKHMQVEVGEDLTIAVGKSRLIMTKEGTIVLRGVKIEVESDKQIRLQSKLIDLN